MKEPQILLLRGRPTYVIFSCEKLTDWLQELSNLRQQEGDFDPPPRQDRTDQFGVSKNEPIWNHREE